MATGAQEGEKVILQEVNDNEFEAHAVAGAMVGETVMETTSCNEEMKSRIENVPSDREQQQMKASHGSSSRGSEQQQQHDKEEDLGMWDSVSRWWNNRKERQKRESLEKQVEEQQQILKNSPYMSIQNEDGVEIYSGLKNNPTYQSATQAGIKTNNSREDVAVSFCTMIGGSGVGDCSGSYSSSSSDVNVAKGYNNSHGESATLVHGEKKRRGKKDRNACPTYDSDEGEDGFIKIASRNDTVSGQGIAVQFEIPQNPNHDRDAFAYVSVVEEKNCTIPPLLTLGQMKNIVSLGLPSSLLYSKWKRLYSLQRDGDSFEGAFLPRVRNYPRSVLVIKTTCGSIFGGFADSPWKGELGNIYSNTVKDASFYGSAQACLFSCNNNNEADKDDVLVYKWTGANRYCQLCDLKNKMIAFGGGGKSGEFGLCVEDDFRVGSTGHCETFDNKPLCETSYFEILDVECWGFVMGIE